MDEQPKSQLLAKLKSANYVLVTVGRNPSVDQLAALIGLTLLLNKAGKHAAAVFSGTVPSTLEFLKPEDTIETTTDSLRDFIIALDKSKADKLRYKVEDDVVRIFITPYRTSITDADLNFSQGDFNVDVVVALGVTEQQDLDEAIVSHGRILHDATVVTVNLSAEGDLGSIHWQEPKASSLSEMITSLVQPLSKDNGKDLIDNQIATALLTGIVAETDRFSNEKTTAVVMSSSAILMAAGANQQLVATELAAKHDASDVPNISSDDVPLSDDLQPPSGPSMQSTSEPKQSDDGSLAISHDTADQTDQLEVEGSEYPSDNDADLDLILNPTTDLSSDEQIEYAPLEAVEASEPKPDHHMGGSKMITEPPTLGGQLTANSHVEVLEPSSDPLGLPSTPPSPLLSRNSPMGNLPQPIVTDTAHQTLSDLEAAVHAEKAEEEPAPPELSELQDSPSPAAEPENTLDAARDEVNRALNSIQDQTLPPVEALNAQPMAYDLHSDAAETATPAPTPPPLVPAPAQASESVPAIPTTPSDQDAAMTKMLHQEVPALPLPPSTTFDPSTFGIVNDPGTPLPGSQPLAPAPALAPAPLVVDPNAAPPVPPPIPFNFGAPPSPPAA